MTNTRAKWVEGVTDLIGNLAEAGNYLNVAQVAEQTGLSPSTIKDLLSRSPITSDHNVLAPISRPARCIGNQPLYSHEQVAEVVERQKKAGRRHLGGGDSPLQSLSTKECKRRGLISVKEIADLAGIHEQTVRRLARDHDDFPEAVALCAREGGGPGVPRVVRKRRDVVAWLTKYEYMSRKPRSPKSA